MDHFNNLTPAEDERLTILIEECAEVIQIACKIQRHGYESKHPDGGPTNRALLTQEVGDVKAIVGIMCSRQDFDGEEIDKAAASKVSRIYKFTHHQVY